MKIKIQWNKFFGLFGLFGVFGIALEVIFIGLFGSKVHTMFGLFQGEFALLGISSIWMFPVYGIAAVLIGKTNEWKQIRKLHMLIQVLFGVLIVNIVELPAGLLLNTLLNFDIWDYSHDSFHIMGQISLEQSLKWCTLVPFVIWTDDALRAILYGQGKVYSVFENFKRIVTDFRRG